MKISINRKTKNCFYRILSGLMAVVFFISTVIYPAKSYAQTAIQPIFSLPAPGTMLGLSEGFHPPIVRGLTIHPEDPLKFDFIIDTGDNNLRGQLLEEESQKLIKYFLASLTTPENELWVNLSPYEKDRIIPNGLGGTEMGRDMLAQDYLLKQLTASLIYPEKDLGNKFWQRVREKAQKMYGTKDLPVDTFNKVWVIPDKATVYEHESSVFVVERHLQIMLEQDYVVMQKSLDPQQTMDAGGQDSVAKDVNVLGSQVVRELIIPEIEKEVNEGKNFAPVRQIYNSMILATWYKKRLREGLLGQVYVNKNKIKGIDLEDKEIKQKIYDQYLEAFKKGVYNYIKEDLDQTTGEAVPHRYFSGGLVAVPQVNILNGSPENVSSSVRDRVLKGESSGKDVVVSSALVENIKSGINNAVLAAAITLGGIVATDTSAQPRNLTPSAVDSISQRSLASVERMKAWLDDTVYKDDIGKGIPRLFRLPIDPNAQMTLWKSIQGNDPLQGVIERVIINDGISTYDASLWQIIQATSGNIAGAKRLTNIYVSGSFGALNDIRAWDPQNFDYQGKRMSRSQGGLFFRIITPRWEQKDPLTGDTHFPGYPGPGYDKNRIVWVDWQPITGENAWIILGNLQSAYVQNNGDKSKVRISKEMKLAESIYDAFDLLTSKIGGIYYAPHGTFGNAPEQHISTENNLSAYAALRMMYEITQDKKYLNKMQGIETFFKNYVWDKANGIFRQGGKFDGQRFTPNPTFAVDVNTWGIAVLGPEKIDQWFGQGAAMKMWQETKKRAGYRQGGKFKGVGFTDGGDIISAEWTAGAIQATLMMADYYSKNSDFANEAGQDAVAMLEGMEEISSVYTNSGQVFKGYKYANQRYFIPFGWWANPIENMASTAWPYFILKGFDPFILGGKNSWIFSSAHIKVIDRQRELDNSRIPQKGAAPAVPVVQSTPALQGNVTRPNVTAQAMVIISTLTNPDPSSTISSREYRAIVAMGPAAVPALIQNLRDTKANTDTRKWSARLLGEVGSYDEVYPILQKVINDQAGIYQEWHKVEARRGLQILNQKKARGAASFGASPDQTAKNEVGGIDFNPANLDLQIKRDDKGMPLLLLQQPIGNMEIEGFYPVIINIMPVNAQNLPILGQLKT